MELGLMQLKIKENPVMINDECTLQGGVRVCKSLIGSVMIFKKSDKQFEL